MLQLNISVLKTLMTKFTKLHTQIKWVTSESLSISQKNHENLTSDPTLWELVNFLKMQQWVLSNIWFYNPFYISYSFLLCYFGKHLSSQQLDTKTNYKTDYKTTNLKGPNVQNYNFTAT